jgi:esterase/lipase
LNKAFKVFLSTLVLFYSQFIFASLTLETLNDHYKKEASLVPLKAPDMRSIYIPYGDMRTQTEYSVLYFHGFSATPPDTTPVPEMYAKHFKANLIKIRFKGHGRSDEGFGDVHFKEWLKDAETGFEHARLAGKKVILVGMSTGSNYALHLLAKKSPRIVGAILMSPNYIPKNWMVNIFRLPFGLKLAKLVNGEYHEWKPRNEQVKVYWTTKYKVEAVEQMMNIIFHTEELRLESIKVPVITLYTPSDRVVNVDKIIENSARFRNPSSKLINFSEAKTHVLGGDKMSPETTELLVQKMIEASAW